MSSSEWNFPIIGRHYKHFKGGIYEVVAIARDNEDLREMVVYRSVSERDVVWTRPLSMWMEVKGGKPRFERYVRDSCPL